MAKGSFPLIAAQEYAERLKEELQPHCTRVEIAGSIRRRKEKVGDIELVLIPKRINMSLFDEYPTWNAVPELVEVVSKYQALKGSLGTGKYTQRLLPVGLKVDLFTATTENWGYILAIRTGSSHFSKERLAWRWVKMGYKGTDGMLTRDGKPIPIWEEQELFELLKMPWVEPVDRH